MSSYEQPEEEYYFKSYFVPLTNLKIYHYIIILGLLVFSPILFNDFLGDDIGQILQNPLVHSIENIPKFFLGSTFSMEGQVNGVYYKPFMSVYFSIIYALFGSNAFPFHFFQLVFHIANAILLYKFLQSFFNKYISFVVVLFFLVHPINVETVAYISNTQDVLYLFFGLLALNFSKKISPSYIIYILIFIFLLSSLLFKETGLLFIPILLLFSYIFNKKHLIKYFGISFFVLLLYILLRLVLANLSFTRTIATPLSEMSLLQRMLNIPEIFFTYIKTFFFPLNLVTPQSWFIESITFKDFYFPLILDILFIITIFATGFVIIKTNKQYFKTYVFFLFWFIIGISLHLQIIPLDVTVAERWFYFPLIGLLGVFGTFFRSLQKIIFPKKLLIVLVILLICLMSIRSFIRTTNWKDGLTLWTHDVKISKDDYLLEYALGNSLYEAKKYDEAKLHLEKSIKIYPYGFNWYHLGVIHAKLGQHAEAIKAFKKAVSIGNNYVAQEELAFYMYLYADPIEAKIYIESTIKKFPKSSRLWLSLALVENKLGSHETALSAAKQSYSLGQNKLNSYVYSQLTQNKPLDIKLK